METKPEWYETFFDGLYAKVLGSERHESRAAQEARLIKRLLRLRKGHCVLDCPCGLGRIAFQLAGMGLNVTGADLTASYVSRARRRAKKDMADVRFIRCDMRDLPFDTEFDAVVNWFTSFGYFDNPGNLATAKAAFAALKPGGKFLIEMMNKSWLLSHFRADHDDTINGVRILSHARWDARTNRVRNRWILSKGRKVEPYRFSHGLYSGAEMRALLRAAGFRDIQLFGRPPLGRFTRHSRRIIAVAKRGLK
jgi:SAM-dependent methyltransferase